MRRVVNLQTGFIENLGPGSKASLELCLPTISRLILFQERRLSWLLSISGVQNFSISQSASLIDSETPYLRVWVPGHSSTARRSEEQTSAQRYRCRPQASRRLVPARHRSSSQLQSRCTTDTSQRLRGGQGRRLRFVHEWPRS